MGKTTIEWTEATWNPVSGCTKVSAGCDHCYAERMSRRLSHLRKYASATKADGAWSGVVSLHPEVLKEPLHWRTSRNIFVGSMSDLFHAQVPWDFIVAVFEVMRRCPQHTFQVLTKRPGRMAYFGTQVEGYWPANVWAGTSVESQKYAPRLDVLARVPAKVRFVSVEPLLEAVDLQPWLDTLRGPGGLYSSLIHWVIVGGESGPGARPMQLDWARSLRDQCQAAQVPFFLKQLGGPHPGGSALLDGREWREFPSL